MKNGETMNELEPRVRALESGQESVLSAIGKLSETVSHLSDKVDRITGTLFDRVNEASKPNFSTLAAWAGILLTIIALVATPIGYFVMRDMDRTNHLIENSDTNRQRELALALATQKESLITLSTLSKEQREATERLILAVNARVDRMEQLKNDETKADLQELRERRNNLQAKP